MGEGNDNAQALPDVIFQTKQMMRRSVMMTTLGDLIWIRLG